MRVLNNEAEFHGDKKKAKKRQMENNFFESH